MDTFFFYGGEIYNIENLVTLSMCVEGGEWYLVNERFKIFIVGVAQYLRMRNVRRTSESNYFSFLFMMEKYRRSQMINTCT